MTERNTEQEFLLSLMRGDAQRAARGESASPQVGESQDAILRDLRDILTESRDTLEQIRQILEQQAQQTGSGGGDF